MKKWTVTLEFECDGPTQEVATKRAKAIAANTTASREDSSLDYLLRLQFGRNIIRLKEGGLQ